MLQNGNKNWTSTMKRLTSENLPAWTHSTSKYFGEFQIRIYPDLLIKNYKTGQFWRSGTSFLLKWTVFLLLQITLIQSVCGQGDKLVYNVDKRHGESISNSSGEKPTISWLQFMAQDAKETIDDWEKVLKMNKPRLLGTEAINLNNSQLEETKMSWMPFMKIDAGDGRETPEEHSYLKRLRRGSLDINVLEGSGTGIDTTTADVTGSGMDTTTPDVTSSGIDTTTAHVTNSKMDTTTVDVTSSGIDTTTVDVTGSGMDTTTAGVTSPGIDTTTAHVTGSNMDTTTVNGTSSGFDTTTADVTGSGMDTTAADVTSPEIDTTTADVTSFGIDTSMADATSSGIDTTTTDVTSSGSDTSMADATSSGIDTTTTDVTSFGIDTSMADATSSGIDTTTTDVTSSGSDTTTVDVTGSGMDTSTSPGIDTTTANVTGSEMDTTTVNPTSSGIETTTAHVTGSEMDTSTVNATSSEIDTTTADVTGSEMDTTAADVSSPGIDTTTADATSSGIDTTTADATSSGIDTTTAHVTGSVMDTTAAGVTTTVSKAVTSGSIETTEGGSGTEEPTEITSGPEPTTAQTTQGQETTATTIMYTTFTAGSACASCNSTNQYCVKSSSSSTDKCECVPGYTLQQNDCERAKQFGGKLHMDVIFNVELSDSTSLIYKSAEVNYTEFLETAYGDQDWFISVQIIGFSSGSTIVEYELATKNLDTVNSTSVQTAFEAFLEDDTYFSTCNCNATACSPKNLNVAFPVMAQESCADAGTATDTLCKSPDIISYCDSNTSSCDAREDGTVQCQCTNQGYILNTETNRSCTAVSCLTSADFGCNEPFGNCVSSNSKGQCECMWGFQGTNCQQAWLFILVIVLSGLILIAIIVGAVLVWRRRHKAKGWNTTGGGTYYHETLPELDRYKNLSEWDEQIGGIVPTSYKRMRDSEPYDDDMILENDNASGNNSGDHEEPNDKQPSLERWRWREIGYGNGVQGEETHKLGKTGGNTGKDSKDSTLTIEDTRF